VTRPFRLDLGDGAFVAGDELPGAPPAYLYLHGLGSVRAGEKSGSLLEHARARGRALVRVDLRGHGESSGRLGQVTIRELANDVERVLAQLGSAVVIGSSLGGLLAALAAAACPERVAALALIAPAFGLVTSLAQRLDPCGRMWTNEGHGFVVDSRVLADAATIDEGALPARLRVPTLVVHGTADEVVPARVSERFAEALASVHKELWLVPGGDHRLADAAPLVWARLDALAARAASAARR
jgi:pimeloyl-ACP methyl ester carboxylesterase